MLTLKEALSNASKYCEIRLLGSFHTVDLLRDDISKYAVYDAEIDIQPVSGQEYFTLYVIYSRSICEDFVAKLKEHQHGIYNGMTLDQIADIYDDLPLSEIKFIIQSCKQYSLLEKQGDLYAW